MRWLVIIWLTLLCPVAPAQLFPLSDFYVFNGLIINPACAGSHDALSTTLQYRNQWAGFKDAPISSLFSAHAPLSNDKMGLGLLVSRNAYGIYRETSVMANYAYRFDLYTGKLSLGLACGIISYHVSWSELEAADPDDILLTDNSTVSIVPDFSVGTYYESRKFFVGFSIPFFLSQEPDDQTGKFRSRNKFNNYNYFVTGGYKYTLTGNLKLEPAVLMHYDKHTGIQGDFYLQADLFDRVKTGIGFRSTGMLIGLISCHINKQLRVSYSFDTDSGKAASYRKGSHEIMIGYLFRYSRNVMNPSDL